MPGRVQNPPPPREIVITVGPFHDETLREINGLNATSISICDAWDAAQNGAEDIKRDILRQWNGSRGRVEINLQELPQLFEGLTPEEAQEFTVCRSCADDGSELSDSHRADTTWLYRFALSLAISRGFMRIWRLRGADPQIRVFFSGQERYEEACNRRDYHIAPTAGLFTYVSRQELDAKHAAQIAQLNVAELLG